MIGRFLLILVFGILPLHGCGSVRPVPATFNQADYTPIDFDQLRLDASSLRAGDLIRCQACFWQFLSYDPAPEYFYFNYLRYPASWPDLEWFALYKDADMQGYYNRGAMSFQQRLTFNPKRLDPIIIYGEIVSMGGSTFYLLVHHLERVTIN
jgi:hypothetical protein